MFETLNKTKSLRGENNEKKKLGIKPLVSVIGLNRQMNGSFRNED